MATGLFVGFLALGILAGQEDDEVFHDRFEELPVLPDPEADLRLEKSASVDEVPALGAFQYLLDIDNQGPDAATERSCCRSWPGRGAERASQLTDSTSTIIPRVYLPGLSTPPTIAATA